MKASVAHQKQFLKDFSDYETIFGLNEHKFIYIKCEKFLWLSVVLNPMPISHLVKFINL